MVLLHAHDLGLVVAFNVDAGNPVYELAQAFLDHYFPPSASASTPPSPSAANAVQYALLALAALAYRLGVEPVESAWLPLLIADCPSSSAGELSLDKSLATGYSLGCSLGERWQRRHRQAEPSTRE